MSLEELQARTACNGEIQVSLLVDLDSKGFVVKASDSAHDVSFTLPHDALFYASYEEAFEAFNHPFSIYDPRHRQPVPALAVEEFIDDDYIDYMGG